MISKGEVRPGNGWRYLFRGVMVGDGYRAAGKPLRAAQDEAGVPPGVWKGRGLAAVGLTAGDVVTERQAEPLLGEGRHPDSDRIERELLAEGESPGQARRATVLGRPIEHNQSPETEKAKERTPWLAMDLVFRAPPTAHIAWAFGDDETRDARRGACLCTGWRLAWCVAGSLRGWVGGFGGEAGVRELGLCVLC